MDIRLDRAMKSLELGEGKICKIAAPLFTDANRMRYGLMGIAEGQALLHEVVREIGCCGKALQSGRAHRLRFDADAGHHIDKNRKRVTDGVSSVEEAFLVFLVILVVGQGLTFHQGEEGYQMAVDTPRLAASQFRHVWVFLLRHDGAAGAETVRQIDKADAGAHPEHQLFRKTRDMR